MAKYLNSRANRFTTCGNCGEEVLATAKACQECGADTKTGLDGLEDAYAYELPGEGFSYEEFMKREFGPMRHLKPAGLAWYWWLTGVALLILLVLALGRVCVP
jgi:hypothetical protein